MLCAIALRTFRTLAAWQSRKKSRPLQRYRADVHPSRALAQPHQPHQDSEDNRANGSALLRTAPRNGGGHSLLTRAHQGYPPTKLFLEYLHSQLFEGKEQVAPDSQSSASDRRQFQRTQYRYR